MHALIAHRRWTAPSSKMSILNETPWLIRVGANLSVKLVGELKRVYDAYLENTVPPGDLPLK